MSDTPRTDAAHKMYRWRSKVSGLIYEHKDAAGDCETVEYVDADFARQLERELAEYDSKSNQQ